MNIRSFLTFLFTLIAIASVNARMPNVVIIYTDDQGSIDINSYGAKDLILSLIHI